MLKWKEDPRDKDSYKAPLILIPFRSLKKRGRVDKTSADTEEDPIFNLTLIEFLQQDYEIDLTELREEVPEDESGIDVALVWQIVRDKIAEQDGFEVVEECVIASFSFTKYLMWKDLRDRMADLKENPFVAHLVDNPQEAYSQNESFLKPRDLDKKVPPTRFTSRSIVIAHKWWPLKHLLTLKTLYSRDLRVPQVRDDCKHNRAQHCERAKGAICCRKNRSPTGRVS